MRTTKVVSITLPPAMYEQARALAKQENRTMSELLREALRRYQSDRRWDEVNALGRAAAERVGVKTEEDVMGIIHEFRRESREAETAAQAIAS